MITSIKEFKKFQIINKNQLNESLKSIPIKLFAKRLENHFKELNQFSDFENTPLTNIQIAAPTNNKLHIFLFNGLDVSTLNEISRISGVYCYQIDLIKVRMKNRLQKDVRLSNFFTVFNSQKLMSEIAGCEFIIEPKMDSIVELKQTVLYHATQSKYWDNISKIGLMCKNKNIKGDHPERIYFSLNEEYCIRFAKNRTKLTDESHFILKVDVSGLNITYYQDPNSQGVYCYENIGPDRIVKLDVII